MSNADIDDRAAKRSALDAFAEAAPRQEMQVMPMSLGSVDRVFGAQQVAVYRDEQKVLQKIAALGAAAGDDWFYRFPVKSKNGQKSFIEGPSIKLANDLARIYGNCEIDTRVIDLGSSWLIYARFTDYETGFALTRPFQQQKGGSRLGGDDDARRLDIAFQIGVSKAIRNVTVNALQTFADYGFNSAKNSIVDKIGKDVQRWRDEMKVRLHDRGVDIQRVEYVIGRANADWTAPDIAKVIAMMKAVADGMATIDDTFPPRDKQTREDIDRETGEVTEGTIGAEASAAAATETADVKTAAASASTSEAGAPAGGEAPATPATANKAKPQPNSSAAAATAEAAANPSKEKAAAKAPAAPTTEAEYVAYATAWINELTDAEEGVKRWAAEKSLRNKANVEVSGEHRDTLVELLEKKRAEIADADKS